MANSHPRKTGRPLVPLEERLWPKIDVQGPDDCWPWLGSRGWDGYGRILIGGRAGQPRPAHRIAWELANGKKMPSHLDACHSCDNRGCCNPKHIWPGTRADNMRDAVRKGRHPSQQRAKQRD